MASVTQRIKTIKQPYGGYLPIKSFSKKVFTDEYVLNDNENIQASLVGTAVDYLTRFMLGDTVDKAFHISLAGAALINMKSKANSLKSTITGLDDISIISACKLAGFDVCFRASISAYKPIENINPDTDTIENVRMMVNRSIVFWNAYGPIVCSKPTCEGGYTSIVDCGDGDYVSSDTLWDFKVSKTAPTSKHSLQILMYYLMGIHSVHAYYKNVTNLGFFNPRLNTAYICPVSSIPQETIDEVEANVIGYGISRLVDLEQPSKKHTNHSYHAIEYTVVDICEMTGIKKSAVYADIRAGKLTAYKKGNKYLISHENGVRYIDKIKFQQKIAGITSGVMIILMLAMMCYMLLVVMN